MVAMIYDLGTTIICVVFLLKYKMSSTTLTCVYWFPLIVFFNTKPSAMQDVQINENVSSANQSILFCTNCICRMIYDGLWYFCVLAGTYLYIDGPVIFLWQVDYTPTAANLFNLILFRSDEDVQVRRCLPFVYIISFVDLFPSSQLRMFLPNRRIGTLRSNALVFLLAMPWRGLGVKDFWFISMVRTPKTLPPLFSHI